MKELDEMEKINAKLSAAVEEVTLEHFKKNEVSLLMSSSLDSEFCSCRFISVTKNVLFKDEIRRRPPVVNAACLLAFHINILFLLMNELDNYMFSLFMWSVPNCTYLHEQCTILTTIYANVYNVVHIWLVYNVECTETVSANT